MKARVYTSEYDTLFVALEDIFLQFKNDYFINGFDFIIFAISPKFAPIDINPTIKKIFNTSNYLAFNATHSFSHNNGSESVTALFIKFEKKGTIKIKNIKNIDNSKLNLIFIPFEENKDRCTSELIENIPASLIGGVCSGEKAYIYFDNHIEKEKPIILEFNNIEYKFGISLGYKPIGPTYQAQVTKRNKVYVIDYEDAPMLAKRLLKNTNGDIKNLWYSPMLVISDKTGLVDVVRTFKKITYSYVEFFGNIEKDANLRLSFATNEMLLEADKKNALNLKKEISPELIFNFSCTAREYILNDKKYKENEIYSQILNAPLFGFFTYGEIGPNYNFKSSKLYNQSSLVVAIKEK